jgi:hypothetical protein
MNVAHAIDRATRLARDVAALDFDDRPIYLLAYSEVKEFAAGLSGGNACLGWTFCTMDLTLRPWLSSQGRWQGRGWAAVLRDDVLRCEADLIDVALHELAHGIEFSSAPAARMPASRLPRLLRVRPRDLPEANDQPDDSRPDRCRADLHHHGIRFIRTALHVAWRSRQAGWRPSLSMMNVAGRAYELRPGRDYQDALGDEPREREAEPIQSILRDAPPPPFERLWQSDDLEV